MTLSYIRRNQYVKDYPYWDSLFVVTNLKILSLVFLVINLINKNKNIFIVKLLYIYYLMNYTIYIYMFSVWAGIVYLYLWDDLC